MQITIRQINYTKAQNGADLVYLMDCYAQDSMGDNTPLDESVKKPLSQT